MHKVVLCHRHTLVDCHLLDLGNIHRREEAFARFKRLPHWLHIEGTIALVDILLHNLAHNRELEVEWQLRICRVAIQATALDKDCCYTLVERIVSRRYSLRDTEDCYGNHCEQQS